MTVKNVARALVVLLLASACSKPPPLVKQRRFSAPTAATKRIAVVPFYPRPMLARSAEQSGVTSDEATTMVTRFVTEAMAEQGFNMVPASDVALAFEANGMPVPRLEPRLAAEYTAKEFGATGVLLGEVLRYRDRTGGSLGAERPASVSFLVTLYRAPEGQRLWSAQFEETQRSFSEDPLRSARYPTRGWMNVQEFTRWGARQVAQQLRDAR